MNRHLIVVSSALALVTALAPSASARRYSDWLPPVNLGPVINGLSNEGGPAISEDGLTLYFNSDRPDGFGNSDIYVARRESFDHPWIGR